MWFYYKRSTAATAATKAKKAAETTTFSAAFFVVVAERVALFSIRVLRLLCPSDVANALIHATILPVLPYDRRWAAQVVVVRVPCRIGISCRNLSPFSGGREECDPSLLRGDAFHVRDAGLAPGASESPFGHDPVLQS